MSQLQHPLSCTILRFGRAIKSAAGMVPNMMLRLPHSGLALEVMYMIWQDMLPVLYD